MVFAHGIGGAQDLPISLPFALAGAGAALAVSFLVLALAWRTPRFNGRTQGVPLPSGLARLVDGGALTWLLRALGLAFTAYVVWAALAGPETAINPTFGVVYVLLWVGLVPASLLFGPFYRAVNPLRTVHLLVSRLTGGPPSQGLVELPRWVGLWPGALGLLAFVWLELVFPGGNQLSSLVLWFTIYFVVVLVGAAIFGDEWIGAADPFEVYSTLVGHLSVFGRTADGTLVVRSPLANLDSITPVPGLLAVASVLVGSTAYDSFHVSVVWVRFLQRIEVDSQLVDTLGLVAFCVAVWLLFAGATSATRAAKGVRRRDLPGLFAHSLVPIVVGYVAAHYLSYFVEMGQQTVIFLSDPMGEGANLLGTADWQINYWLSTHQTFLAFSKVAAIVGGHVLGVVAAHDRAVKLLPKRDQLTGQLPLLFVMVGFTVGGLYLLLTV